MKIKKYSKHIVRGLLFAIFLFFPLHNMQGAEHKFKTVGYLPDYDTKQIETVVNFEQLTDVNYFSLIPQADGELDFTDSGSEKRLKDFVALAHSHDVRVGISIGGWGLSDNFVQATSKDTQKKFIRTIVDFVDTYDLDTVDIDWEYPGEAYASRFETFIVTLKKALGTTALSICVPSGVTSSGHPSGQWERNFTPASLKTADWVNIMAYDAQVEGFPNHSPVNLQKNSLNYWNDLLGGDHMQKLVAGIPFYSKATNGAVLTYREVLHYSADIPTGDKFTYKNHTYYFNNKSTVQTKVNDTIKLDALGVMIWAPTQDNPIKSSRRLMDVVTDTLEKNNVPLDHLSQQPLEKIEKNVQKEGKRFKLIVVSILFVVSVQLLRGRWLFLLPRKLSGKRVNRKKMGASISLLLFLVAFILALSFFVPLYILIAIIAMLVILAFFLLNHT